jgi:tetratricopeptide (TPR) repeat protein
MKKSQILIFIAVLILSVISCKHKPLPDGLNRAKALMNSHPDSALNILESMAIPPERYNAETWKVLHVQALDRNYLPIIPYENIMLRSVRFFDSIGNNPEMQAKSHYYLGRIYQDKGNEIGTVREFLAATPYAEIDKDSALIVNIKSNLGFLLWNNGLLEQADSLYRQIIPLNEMIKDWEGLAIGYNRLGDFAMLKAQPENDSAKYYLKKSLSFAEKAKNTHTTSNVYYSLGVLSINCKKAKEAINYARRCRLMATDSVLKSSAYIVLGESYSYIHRLDSAEYFLSLCLRVRNVNVLIQANQLLSNISKEKGDKNKALYYSEQCSAYKDSLSKIKYPLDISNSIKDAIQNQIRVQYKSSIFHYKALSIVILLILIVCVGIFVYLRRHRNKIIHDLEMENKKLNSVQNKSLRGQISETDIFKRLLDNLHFNENIVDRINKTMMKKSDWDELLFHINELSPDFIKALTDKYEGLTLTDIRFCCLVRLEFTYAEIANIEGYTLQAIGKRKMKIKGRMNLKTTKEIRDIVMKL